MQGFWLMGNGYRKVGTSSLEEAESASIKGIVASKEAESVASLIRTECINGILEGRECALLGSQIR